MKKSLLCLFSFVLLQGYAQETKPDAVKITVFQPSSEALDTEPTSPQRIYTNIIKWNYSAITRGVFLLNYERPLNDMFAAEVGLGMTTFDLFYETFTDSYIILNNGVASVRPSIAAEAGIKIYPRGGTNFEGFYIQPNISYRQYRGLFTNNYNALAEKLKVGYNFLDSQVRIGFQYESILGTEIRGDFYFGAGLRRATNIVATYLDNYYNNQPPAYDTVKEKYFLPQIIAGIKLGFPF